MKIVDLYRWNNGISIIHVSDAMWSVHSTSTKALLTAVATYVFSTNVTK